MTATYQLDSGEELVVLYFTEVANVEEVTEKLASQTHPFSRCTIVNSDLIVDPFQIAIAANKAIVAEKSGNMITKSLTTELLFNLSTSENITTSLERFGFASSGGDSILMAVFGSDAKKIEDLKAEVKGTLQSDFASKSQDTKLIRSIYDIKDDQLVNNELLNLIVTKIACKSL